MSLSDRLQRAKTERLIAAGFLTSEHALKPEPAEDTLPVDEPEPVVAPITIEVLSSGLHLVADGAPSLTATPDAEHPQNCPKCNAAGVVDLVDLVGHTTHLTCPICGTMWQVRQTDDAPITQ